jgi:hypothetical protein
MKVNVAIVISREPKTIVNLILISMFTQSISRHINYVCLLVVAILSAQSLSAQLSGVKTIGGSSPDYATFTAAVSALTTSGVNGSVTFRVRSGTYNERIQIGNITGASLTNRITFEIDPSATTQPLLQYTNSSTSNNYVVNFNGARHVRFKGLKIKANGTSYSRVVTYTGACDSVVLDSNVIEGVLVSSTSTNTAVIYEESGVSNVSNRLVFTRNTISGGSYGMYVYGYSTSSFQTDWVIRQNEITNWYYYGVYLYYYFLRPLISENNFVSAATTGYGGGIRSYYNYDININRNRVELKHANLYYGLDLNYSYSLSSTPNYVSNNMIMFTATNSSNNHYGIYSYYSNYQQLVYNSIRVASGLTSYGIYSTGASNTAIRNNAVSMLCSGSGYGIYRASTAYPESNNCAYYPLANAFSSTPGTGSFVADPQFDAPDDLHTSNILLNGTGTPITSVTIDFDGQSRHTTTPDIGADEFTPANNDAGVAEIVNTSFCPGSTSVHARVKNYGGNNITSVTINWLVKVNSGSFVTQTPRSITANLVPGKDTIINLGNYTMVKGNNYTIRAYTSAPNATTDGKNANDTTVNSKKPALSGIYTIGGTSPDYISVNAAKLDLDSFGVCGPVTFHLRAGVYNEQITFNKFYEGASNLNTITFKTDPSASTLAELRQNYGVIYLSGTAYLRIDSLKITSLYGNPFTFMGMNRNIKVRNNEIKGYSTPSSSTSYALIYDNTSSTAINHDVEISENSFKYGSYGIYCYGTSSDRESHWNIQNNSIDSFGYMAIHLNYTDSISIANNVINSGSYGYYGIYSNYGYPPFNITSNYIHLENNYTSHYGIYLNNSYGSSVTPFQLVNNYLYCFGTSNQYGIYLSGGYYLNIYYNTSRINSTNSSSSYSIITTTSNCNYLNNNWVAQSSNASAFYCNTVSNIVTSNYNNFYAVDPTPIYVGGSRSLSGWQSYSSKDANSVSTDPFFRTAKGPIPNAAALNNSASTISGISTDIYGVTRGSSPDIGCVEFVPTTNDAAVTAFNTFSICPGSTPVKFRVQNTGSNSITTVRLQWAVSVNSGTWSAQTAYTFSGSLASAQDTMLTLGNFTFVFGNTYRIRAYVDMVNSGADGFHGNDTLISNVQQPAFSGVYTIGGTSPDFVSVGAALTALNTYGICGPVTFNVRPGTYTGSNTYQAINGANSTNTITFKTAPGASSRAVFSNSYYPIYLDGGRYFRFDSLDIVLTGSSYLVYMTGANTDIQFKNCLLQGSNISSTSTSYSVFYDNSGSSSDLQDLLIENNLILYGSYAFYLNGSSATSQSGVIIRNNTIRDYYYMGLRAQYCNNMLIEANKFLGKNNTTTYGLYLNYAYGVDVLRNDIQVGRGYGIYSQFSYQSGTDTSLFANNFINVWDSSNSSSNVALYSYYDDYARFYYNTIVDRSLSSSSYAAYFYYGAGRKFFNNVLVANSGYTMYLTTISSLQQANNNSYYSSGTNLAYASGNRTSLTAWQNATGFDANSLNANPSFFSTRDLHTQSSAINNMGRPIAGITSDIDGNSRSTTAPDMGADEFNVYALDAGIREVINGSICGGSVPVRVKLANFGTTTLTSTKIKWSVSINAGTPIVQTPKLVTGNITTGNDTTVTLGNYTFSGSNNYRITAWIDSLNNTPDQFSGNNSAQLGPQTPAMSGVFTIGGTSPDFASISAALTALGTTGVCGPVTFHIRPGTYTGSNTYAAINGASSVNTITFKTDPSYTTRAVLSNSYYPIYLDGGKYFIFDNLQISLTGSSYLVYLTGLNKGITFKNCLLEGATINSSSSSYSVFYDNSGSSSDLEDFRVENNHIKNGSYAFYLYGSSTTSQRGIVIKDNLIENYYYYGVYAYYCANMRLEGNKFKDRGNVTGYSLFLYYTYGVDIHANDIEQRSGYVLYSQYCYPDGTDTSKVVNNMFNIWDSSNTGTSYIWYSYYDDYIQCYYNTFNDRSLNSSSMCLYNYYSRGIRIANNVFASNQGYNIYNLYGATGLAYSNNNSYYTGGSYIGYHNGVRTNLAAWQTATGMDANSVTVNPVFYSTRDLHTSTTALNNAGRPITGITSDIDGDPRSTTTPDIGADEFSIMPNDGGLTLYNAGVMCSGNQPVKVVLTNQGSNTLNSAKIRWSYKVNSGTYTSQTPLNASSLALPTNADTTLSLGNVTFATGSYYSFVFYIDSVNNGIDQNHTNDTILLDSITPALNGIYTVRGASPDFATLDAAARALNSGGVCGAVTLKVRPGSYTDSLHIGDVRNASLTNFIKVMTDTAFSGTSSIIAKNAVSLYGTKYLTIYGMELRTFGTYTPTVLLRGQISNLNILNSTIYGDLYNMSSSHLSSAIFFDSQAGDTLRDVNISNNLFLSGSYGVYLNSVNARKAKNVVVNDNAFKRQSYGGIMLAHVDTAEVARNIFDSVQTANNYTKMGLYMLTLRYFDIYANQVYYDNSPGYGLYMNSGGGSSAFSVSRVFNNLFHVGGNVSGVAGMYIANMSNIGIYFNSINCSSSGSTSYGLYMTSPTNSNYVYNNNIANTGGGYAYYLSNNQPTQSDYNNLYTSGTNLAYASGARTTLAQWQGATGRDYNSKNVAPAFYGSKNLRTSSVDLNGAATPIAGITTDFEGDARNSSTPDIGADEFNPVPNDLAVVAISGQACPGTSQVQLDVRNTGSNTIALAKVKWYLQTNTGGFVQQGTYSFSGTLASGASATWTLGNISINATDHYTLRAIVDSVNNGADANGLNDTVVSPQFRSAMAGHYTISSTGNFTSLSAAYSSLAQYGVCAPVVFHVAQGNYFESLTLSTIAGANATNTITFIADTLNTAAVLWNFNGNPLRLSNAHHYRFEGLVIRNNNVGSAVLFENNSTNIQFNANTLQSAQISTSNITYSVVYKQGTSSYNISGLIMRDNLITGGSNGIYLGYGSSQSNWIFTGNTLNNFLYYGAYLTYVDSLQFAGNDLKNSFHKGVYACYVQNVSNLKFTGNKIDFTHYNSGTNGVQFNGISGSTSAYNEIYNNMVSVKGSSGGAAMYLGSVNYCRVSYNSLLVISGSSGSNYGLAIMSGGNNDFRNNNVVNRTGNPAIYVGSSSSYSSLSNYNNYYGTSSTPCNWLGTSYSLVNFRSVSSRDNNSVSGDPYFVNDSNLHALGAITNAAGTPIVGITTDIDGNIRSTTTPDIGADEYTPLPFDIGVVSVKDSLSCAGTRPVMVALKNFGTATITSAQIHWIVYKNGVPTAQAPYSWSGSLTTGNTDNNVSLGSIAYGADTSYQIVAYAAQPNSNTDQNAINDTAVTTDRAPAMNGLYTVGSGGAFSSLGNAVSALHQRGVCGPVTLRILSGSYTESVSIGAINGTSANNTITVEGDPAASTRPLISHSGNIFNLQDARFIRIRHLRLSSSNQRPIQLLGHTRNITIDDNHISSVSNYSNHALIHASIQDTDRADIVISNNVLSGGGYGVYVDNNSNSAKRVIIENNEISGFNYEGIVVARIDSLVIIRNTVTDTSYSKGSKGLFVMESKAIIEQNRIVMNVTGGGSGMYIYTNANNSTNRGRIVNNSISVTSNTNGANYALLVYQGGYLDIYFNSVELRGSGNSGYGAIHFIGSASNVLRNNIGANFGTGYAIFVSNPAALSSSNYNNWYTAGSQLGYYNGSRATLTHWQSAGLDANGVSVNPNFGTPFELMPNNVALDNRGLAISSITTDIRDSLRHASTPDIGAYEFRTRQDDAGVISLISNPLCEGSNNVLVALKNFGGDTLKSVRVHWDISVDGSAWRPQTFYSWNGNMYPTDADSLVNIGTYNFKADSSYTLRLYTSLPNNKTDELLTNDTLLVNVLVRLDGIYTIGGGQPNFATISEAVQVLNNAGLCGAVTFKVRPGNYNENVYIGSVYGMGSAQPIRFTADTGAGQVMISDSVSPVRLGGVSHLTLHHLGIEATGNNPAIALDGQNTAIHIDSCRIYGPPVFSTSGAQAAIFESSASGSVPTGLRITGNEIYRGSMGISLSGNSTYNRDGRLVIQNNSINQFYYAGIVLEYTDSSEVAGNTIHSNSSYSQPVGLQLTYTANAHISANRVYVRGSGASMALHAQQATGTAGQPFTVFNNFFAAYGSDARGVQLSGVQNLNFFYNSVSVSNALSASNTYAYYQVGGSNVSLMNNSFANFAGGYAMRNSGGLASNYNNWFTTGSQLFYSIGNLSSWQSFSSQDANSVSADPIYLSQTDLHAFQTLMDSTAVNIGGIATDIDGDVRDASFPDIGADEFDLVINVGIVEILKPERLRGRKHTSLALGNNEEVEVVVRNYGPTVSNIPLEYRFNGTVGRDTISSALQPGQFDTISFTQRLNLDTLGVRELMVFTAHGSDQFTGNDTLNPEVVTFENDAILLPFEEGFEGTGTQMLTTSRVGIDGAYRFDYATTGGRMRSDAGYPASGARAITLDRPSTGTPVPNDLILTLNMSRYNSADSIYLSFDYISHRDVRDSEDSIWVRGSDTSAWIGIYDWWRNRRDNRVKTVVDLSVTHVLLAAGQQYSPSFQVRFGHKGRARTPLNGVSFDNVRVRAIRPYDIELKAGGVMYAQVPLQQKSNVVFGHLHNNGYMSADSVTLQGRINAISDDLLVGTVAPDADTLVQFIHAFNPALKMGYRAEIDAQMKPFDLENHNDTLSATFIAGDSVLARDYGVIDTTVGWASAGVKMGTWFVMPATDTLTSASFFLNRPTVGDSARVILYEQGTSGIAVKAQSPTVTFVSNAGRWYTLPFGGCKHILTKGKSYLIAVSQLSSNDLTLGATYDNFMPGASVYDTSAGWHALEDIGKPLTYAIRANFGYYDLPDFVLQTATCINSAPISLSSSTHPGGTFFGAGVSGNSFNPSAAGYGTHQVYYTLTNTNGCTDTNARSILVDSIPVVSFASPADVCDNVNGVLLNSGTPAGGYYYGTGVSGSYRFNADPLSPGTYTLGYTYANTSGCRDSADATIRVLPLPSVSLGALPPVCIDKPAFVLTQGTPLGGAYFGLGVSNDSLFTASIAGVGNRNIGYTYADSNSCRDTAFTTIVVNPVPLVDLGRDTSICGKQILTLDAGNSGATYQWNTGETSRTLAVNKAGTFSVVVTDGNACSASDTIAVDYSAVCTGLADATDNYGVRCYPNPTAGIMEVRLIHQGAIASISLFTLQGVMAQEWSVEGAASSSIDLSQMAAGVYLLRIETDTETFLQRVSVTQ